MKTWVRKTLSVGVLAAGALLFAPGAAHADTHQVTGDNNGILNGTQIAVPVQVPVNIVGNALGILGVADTHAVGVNQTESGRLGDVQRTGDNNGILNGTQVYLPVSVPVNAVGNSAAVLGAADTHAVGVNNVRGRKAESAHTTEGGWFSGGGQISGDNNGILNGTQIYAPIDVPINVCGNSLAILGGSYTQAFCANNVSVRGHRRHHGKESAHVTEGGWQIAGDNNGIANGTQLYAPISLPVNLSGNSAALLGVADSHAVSVNESGHGDGFVQGHGDDNGILNGTQIGVPINVPINVCGNSLGILGAASSHAACVNGLDFGGDDFGGWGGDNGNTGHGHHGHHGHHGNGNGNDNAGDNGDDDSYLGDNGAADGGYGNGNDNAADDNGYGNGNDNAADDNGYGGQKPASNGSDSDSKGGRESAKSPVEGLTGTVSNVSDSSGFAGLGLLNTLR
ncbi:chaplin family protein [Actinoplanes sp. CA-030573]|uniref:chaplin family protein n=1 Tax=Actinoplanes sp. CA-030573 TaxID=3239898 RepID=UPI003D9171DE